LTAEHASPHAPFYRNGDTVQQRLGRDILASRNAVILIPRQPLRFGASYRAVVEVNGRVIDWTFGIGVGGS
jgi:hypothetical protein